jgi:hypothetical protein
MHLILRGNGLAELIEGIGPRDWRPQEHEPVSLDGRSEFRPVTLKGSSLEWFWLLTHGVILSVAVFQAK